MRTTPLPTEPGDVTPDWLTRAMRADHPGASVTDLAFEAVGTGLMGRSYRFSIQGTAGLPDSVVIKVPSADIATRQLGARAYRKEVGFYREVAPAVAARVPHCHHADISEDGEAFVLVLEDIRQARQGDQVTGCNPRDAAVAVRNLARLHASTWGDESLARRSWCATGPGDASLGDYLPFALAAFEERFAGALDPDTLPVFRAFVDRAEQWSSMPSTHRAAVHGDYRLDNLLFAHDGSTVTTVDWQTVDYLNPGRDIAYFLGNSLTTDDRRAHEPALFDTYLDELGQSGVSGYSTSIAQVDLRLGTFQGPMVTMLGAFVASRTERSERMFAAMANRAAAQIIDHDALDLLP